MPPQRPNILSAFLGKITRNLSLDRYKLSHAAKRGGGQLPVALEELGQCISSGEDVEEELALKELSRLPVLHQRQITREAMRQTVLDLMAAGDPGRDNG
jgi:hypothetical protein